MTQIKIDPRLRKMAFSLLETSPDYLVDMGILFHILCCRQFQPGPGMWWADVPINYLAKKGRIGKDRLYAALDRLENMGVIIPANGNATASRRRVARRYKVVSSFDDKLEKRRMALKKLSTETLLYKEFDDGAIVERQGPMSDTRHYPICPVCEERYHPTTGVAPNGEELCIECWINQQLSEGKTILHIYGDDFEFEQN